MITGSHFQISDFIEGFSRRRRFLVRKIDFWPGLDAAPIFMPARLRCRCADYFAGKML